MIEHTSFDDMTEDEKMKLLQDMADEMGYELKDTRNATVYDGGYCD